MSLKNKQKIAILGYGREGRSVLKFLKKDIEFKNLSFTVLDKKTNKNYLKNLNDFDIIFRSPGVPYNLTEIQNAVKKGVKFSSATNLFFQRTKKINCKIIGITGTKGKGTTSTLLYKILKNAGKNVYLAGNIGKPAIEILPKLNKNSIVILELSSFQLQDLKYSPDIAIVLGIFSDHMDTHKNFKEYFNAKANITKFQTLKSKIFYDAENNNAGKIAALSKGKKISVSTKNFKLFKQTDLKIPGKHNFKNAALAAIIAKDIGINEQIIKNTAQNYKGMRHRLEFVRKIKNIVFYNDSASTNPYTAAAAIKSFSGLKILIAGGKDKNLNYFPLAKALRNSNTNLVILFGENKNKIKKQLLKIKNGSFKIIKAKNLKIAVQLAYKTAKKLSFQNSSLIFIILSPASASFDIFKDYKDRGEQFKKIVLKST